jgi:hypothetical protein
MAVIRASSFYAEDVVRSDLRNSACTSASSSDKILEPSRVYARVLGHILLLYIALSGLYSGVFSNILSF